MSIHTYYIHMYNTKFRSPLPHTHTHKNNAHRTKSLPLGWGPPQSVPNRITTATVAWGLKMGEDKFYWHQVAAWGMGPTYEPACMLSK